jgi:hypothetical protein
LAIGAGGRHPEQSRAEHSAGQVHQGVGIGPGERVDAAVEQGPLGLFVWFGEVVLDRVRLLVVALGTGQVGEQA